MNRWCQQLLGTTQVWIWLGTDSDKNSYKDSSCFKPGLKHLQRSASKTFYTVQSSFVKSRILFPNSLAAVFFFGNFQSSQCAASPRAV